MDETYMVSTCKYRSQGGTCFMNILSIVTVALATFIITFTIENTRGALDQKITKLLWLVEFSLSWWCVGYTMFYTAGSKEAAWFWHNFSSVGWSTIASVTSMYFIVFTHQEKKYFAKWKKIPFILIPLLIFLRNVLLPGSSVAVDLVESSSGLGWTYISELHSFWYWFFILQMIGFFGIAFWELFCFYKRAKYKMKRHLAIGFVILDAVAILFGLLTDFILPHFSTFLPPMSVVAIGIFQIGYYVFLYQYDIYNFDNVVTSRVILETCENPILLLNDEGNVARCNSAASNLMGYTKKEILGTSFEQYLTAGKYKDSVLVELRINRNIHNISSKITTKDGQVKNIVLSVSVIEDEKKEFQGTVISFYDVTNLITIQKDLQVSNEKYKKQSEELYRLSYHDALTGLPNRRKFYEVLSEYYHVYVDCIIPFAIVYMDLDGFKEINDTYGHEAGDRVLVLTANKINQCIQHTDFLSRMGGDEFVCLIADKDIEKRIQKVIKKIQEQFDTFELENVPKFHLGISIGFSIYNGEQMSLDELVSMADRAMYEQKNKKKRVLEKDV